MEVKRIRRKWQTDRNKSRSDEKFYNTTTWRKTKEVFKEEYTEWNGEQVSNRLCLECYKEGVVKDMYAVDHIIPIEEGGNKVDFSNLQSLCKHHHESKSAKERWK